MASIANNCHFYVPSVGCLHLNGTDRVTFLQRQTTNDVSALSPEKAVTTVLTSATARILDVLQLFEEGETIHIIPLPGRADGTYNYLRRRIFFNDNVTLANASAEYTILDLEGEHAGEWLRDQGFEPPPKDGFVAGSLGGIPTRAVGQPGLAGIGYRLITRAGAPLAEHLETAGILPLSPEDYEILRVEAGIPAVGHELTEGYTPHETNSHDWINDNKGCYTGQEVLARQVTYDKITRHLVGLKLDAEARFGAKVLMDGKPIGNLTSTVISPRLGPLALAVIKRPYHEPGTSVTVETETKSVGGIVVPLPFPK